MLNCLHPGGRVWFSRNDEPKRKLRGTWELGETPHGRLACFNTGRANALVEEALRAGVIAELAGFTGLRREVGYGAESSRADFRLDFAGGPAYVEVKSVTLGYADSRRGGLPRRGDRARQQAPARAGGTGAAGRARGAAVLREPVRHRRGARGAGDRSGLRGRTGTRRVAAGVEVLAYGAEVSPEGVWLNRRLRLAASAGDKPTAAPLPNA